MPEQKNNKIKGLKATLPEIHEYFTFVKKVIRHRFRQSGFRRISAPLLQPKSLFEKIFSKDSRMLKEGVFCTSETSQDDLILSPFTTAGILNAFVENKMYEQPMPLELYSIEAEFHANELFKQGYFINAQIVGEKDSVLDAQLIHLAKRIFEDLGILHLLSLEINNVGCRECQDKYIKDLKDFYFDKKRSLCENCKKDIETNPLNLFNCKEEDCQILSALAPKIENYLCESCKEYKKQVFEFLDALEIKYEYNPLLMFEFPSLATNTVFKFIDKKKQTAVQIGSGACYFDLIKTISTPELDIPARGYSFSIEKAIALMKKEKIKVPSKDAIQVFVAQLGQEAKKKCLVLMEEMRDEGIKSVGALGTFSINEQVRLANGFKVPYMLILGLTEVRENTILLRNMKVGSQVILPYDEIIDKMKELIGENNIDTYSPGEILY